MSHSEDIAAFRKEYRLAELLEQDVDPDPIRQFHKWFKHAVQSEVNEPNAMCLSTVDNNKPDSRIVLLKGIEHHGFVFYTNYLSSKGRQIAANPNVHLNFTWLELERQVRIGGVAVQLSDAENDQYFSSRPFESQVGAIVSVQSSVLSSREELTGKMQQALEAYRDKTPQRPAHWGGYLVKPETVEFWQGRPGRLHDRLRYSKQGEVWQIERLSP